MFLPLYACHLYREQDCSSCNLLKNSTSVVSLKMPFFLLYFRTNTMMLLMKSLRQFGKCSVQTGTLSCAQLHHSEWAP